jgi:outer membrane protein OmpA-like peptidoglycan-associated protein
MEEIMKRLTILSAGLLIRSGLSIFLLLVMAVFSTVISLPAHAGKPIFATKAEDIKAILGAERAPVSFSQKASGMSSPGISGPTMRAPGARRTASYESDDGTVVVTDAPELNSNEDVVVVGEPEYEAPRVAALVMFKHDSTSILSESYDVLDEYGKALSSRELGRYRFCVEGHTDSKGTEAYNQKLSERRAAEIVDYLVEHFQMDRSRLYSRGWGETSPIEENDSSWGRQRNRRVEFVRLN